MEAKESSGYGYSAVRHAEGRLLSSQLQEAHLPVMLPSLSRPHHIQSLIHLPNSSIRHIDCAGQHCIDMD